MRVLGLMSGTALDGIDAALVNIHGVGASLRWDIQHALTHPLPPALRRGVMAATQKTGLHVSAFATLDIELAEAFKAAAAACLEEVGLSWEHIDLIASHGQTIWHAPGRPQPHSLQLGHGGALAALTGVTTVFDFRVADVTLGGQGAPLVPFIDRLLAKKVDKYPPGGVIFQNIGGIGNMTWVPDPLIEGSLTACDTGPGNCLIDAAVERFTHGKMSFDADGLIAAEGQISEPLLNAWLTRDAFLKKPAPKSTGREYYSQALIKSLARDAAKKGVTGPDFIATLTAYTAASIAETYRQVLGQNLAGVSIYVSGGGAANPTLVEQLRQRVAPAEVFSLSALNVPPKFKEAFAFAVLGYQTIHGIPNNLPEATGASQPWVLGTIAPGRNFRHVLLSETPGESRSDTVTEMSNPNSQGLDDLEIADMVELMHQQDWAALRAVGEARETISTLIHCTAKALRTGGRLFYVGAGTSGRLGVLDASECPPTFSTNPELVQALIAGGEPALRHAVEGAEDDAQAGEADLAQRGVSKNDVVVGISANGHAPYVRAALHHAKAQGAVTALITCNQLQERKNAIEHVIYLPSGPEIIAGSTRLKAGTATKLVLNMLSTLTMVTLGKVHDNLMVDLTVSNKKLHARALKMLIRLTGVVPDLAAAALENAKGNVKVAAVMLHQNVDRETAHELLIQSDNRLRPWLRT
jgi:anhydro-N-acetylmuramic acid kinase